MELPESHIVVRVRRSPASLDFMHACTTRAHLHACIYRKSHQSRHARVSFMTSRSLHLPKVCSPKESIR